MPNTPMVGETCIHDMFPDWCAICLKLKSPEDEAKEEAHRFDRWLDSLD